MKRSTHLIALFVLFSCFTSAATVWAGDANAAKRSVNAAKSNLESRYFDQAEIQLEHATRFCDGLDDAVKAPILKEVEELRKQVAAGRVKRKQEEIISMLDRYIGTAKGQIDEERGLGDRYDQDLDRAEKALKKEGPQLDEADRKRLEAELETIKKQATTVGLINKLTEISRTFDRADRSRGSGDYSGAEESLKEIETIIKQFPADDARIKPVVDRVATTRAEMATAQADAAQQRRTEKVAPALQSWAKTLKDNAAADAETAPSIEKFRTDSTVGNATIRRIRDIDSWFSWNKEVIKEYESDAELKTAVEQARKLRADDAEKLCRLLTGIMEALDKMPVAERDGQYDAAHQIVTAGNSLEESMAGAPSRDKMLAAAKTYSAKWIAERDADKKAAEQRWAKLTQQAEQTWAGWEKQFPSGDFDALDCVRNINSYKGKTIVLKGLRNRAGWDFNAGGYDVIVPVNGTPVAMKFNPEIVKAGQELAKTIPNAFGTYDIHALAAVVKGTCRVERIEYSQITKQHYTIGFAEAPLLEIVAYSAGPMAARVGHKAGVSDSDGGTSGVAAAGVLGGTASASSVGLLGWTWRLFSVMLCVAAGLACLTRAKVVLAPQMVQLAQVEAKVGKENLDYIGIGLACCGLLWLLVGLVYRDLLPAAALFAAGVFIALDFLLVKGILKEPHVSKLRPRGAMVGLACAGLGVLHLILGGLPLV
jgi:hypothetical protein